MTLKETPHWAAAAARRILADDVATGRVERWNRLIVGQGERFWNDAISAIAWDVARINADFPSFFVHFKDISQLDHGNLAWRLTTIAPRVEFDLRYRLGGRVILQVDANGRMAAEFMLAVDDEQSDVLVFASGTHRDPVQFSQVLLEPIVRLLIKNVHQ